MHETTQTTHYDEHDRDMVLNQLSDIRQEIEFLEMERERFTHQVVAGEIDAGRYGREMEATDMRDQTLKKHERALLMLTDKIQLDLARTALNSQ